MLPLFDGLDGDVFAILFSCLFETFLEAVLIFSYARAENLKQFTSCHTISHAYAHQTNVCEVPHFSPYLVDLSRYADTCSLSRS